MSDQRLRLDDFFSRLAVSVQRALSRKTDRLRLKFESLVLLHPGRRIVEYSDRLSQIHQRLTVAERTHLRFLRQRLDGGQQKLQSLSPLAILQRGYSITRLLPSKEIIRRTSQLKPEDRVDVKVHQGEFTARVEEVKDDAPS
jgi:exodeoxyribonuclease VII large subunit